MEIKGKPRLFKGPAAAYESRGSSAIIREFGCGKTSTDRCGGLISLRNMTDHLRIEIYCVDGPVKIITPPDPSRDNAADLLALLEAAVDIASNEMLESAWGVQARAIITKAKEG